jgi:eukaryotic-like serine/threonine-protein kinase
MVNQQPTTILVGGRYQMLRQIGGGAFGITFLAKDLHKPGQPFCVVKQLIPTQINQNTIDRFEKEAITLDKLGKNAGIPELFAHFPESQNFYLVQEYIEGHDLTEEITPGKPKTEAEVIQLIIDILIVLAIVHKNQIVHRDLKPANIRRRTDGKIFLIDFGVVKSLTNQISSTQRGIGTMGYMPMEQLLGSPKYSSDIYAVGILALEAISGKSIGDFEISGLGQVKWQNHVKVSDRFAQILSKMIDPNHELRYQDAQSALNDIVGPNPPHKKFTFETKKIQIVGNTVKYISQTLQAEYIPFDLGNNVILEMVYIPGGTFTMGTDDQEIARLCKEYDTEWFKCESPQHQVTLQPFYIAKYPITQEQWQQVAFYPTVDIDLNPDPSYFKGAKRPVEQVSWEQAKEFCQRLNQHFNINQNQPNNHKFHLTTEAQWEYACRAGTKTTFYFGETITTDLANYDGNYIYGSESKGKYREQTTEVGTFPPNAFGIYDMHGNVWEWCADDWHDNYQNAPIDGGAWIESIKLNNYMVVRGGSWYNDPLVCRSAGRNGFSRDGRDGFGGFRLVFSPFRT